MNAIAPDGVLTPGVQAATAPQASAEAEARETDAPADPAARIPMGRLGDPDEIGRVALFLASALATYLTGSQVVVDGGMLLS